MLPRLELRLTQTPLGNKAGAIDVHRLSQIMENVVATIDPSQFLMSASRSVSILLPRTTLSMTNPASQVSQYAGPSSQASYEESPRSSFASSPQSPSRVFQSLSPDEADYDNDQEADYDTHQAADQPQYSELNSLYAVPQPVRYAEPNLRDSAYGSSQTDDVQNCWQHGNVALGEQMLTDPDYSALVDRDSQLSGISARYACTVSPGYQCSYGTGLEDDDLMMITTANGEDDRFYMS